MLYVAGAVFAENGNTPRYARFLPSGYSAVRSTMLLLIYVSLPGSEVSTVGPLSRP